MDKETASEKSTASVMEVREIGGSEVVYEMPSCGGCRTCELACSFHHTQTFVPSLSSLKVLDRNEGPGYRVSLVAAQNGERIACDGCKGLDVPACIECCKEIDDLGKILLHFEDRYRR
jgi:Fe-S-cluster-containing hydrogenase component 2